MMACNFGIRLIAIFVEHIGFIDGVLSVAELAAGVVLDVDVGLHG